MASQIAGLAKQTYVSVTVQDVRIWVTSHAYRQNFAGEEVKNSLETPTCPVSTRNIVGEELETPY